ncbi:PaaI family thioesterase [Acidipropionibacterium virtanenii]|uniref:Esterase n=1 Tax=Acidipropionibacterium virtanenii TaxID=2057246 RepID=A0A344UV82_9ACTN|nr:PaaI family thioesterase [Acidipropionibacterium virtanenii]AXE39180.1 Putative esterase [Acidipropionibacterium virtanenii]
MGYTTSDGVVLPDWLQGLVSPLDDKLGVAILELTAASCTVSAPLHGNTQPTGLWHGGASGVLVETAGSLAAMCHARQMGMGAVGVELSVSHLRAPRGDQMTAVSTALHLGRHATTHSVEIRDDLHRLCAVGRVSCQVIPLDHTDYH